MTELRGRKTGYMCSIDFDEHLEHDFEGVPVYTSLKSIQHHRKCVSANKGIRCGVYKVTVSVSRVVRKERYHEHQ